jgi:hypothetical protein
MSSFPPPNVYFNGIIYDSAYFTQSSSGLSLAQANAKYLRKTISDTATALETFNGGLTASGTITLGTADSAVSIGSNTSQTSNIVIGTKGALITGTNKIVIGETTNALSLLSGTINTTGTLTLNTDVNNGITIGKSGGTNNIILNRPLSLQYPTTAISTKAFCGRTTEVVQVADVSLGAGENTITGFFPITAGVYIINYAFRIKGASTSMNMCESWFNSSLQSGVNAFVQYGNHAYYSTPSSLLGSNVICQTGSAVLTLNTDTIVSFKIFVSYSGTAPTLEKDFSYYSYTRLA